MGMSEFFPRLVDFLVAIVLIIIVLILGREILALWEVAWEALGQAIWGP